MVYGATLSSLREEWNLDPATAGLLGSVPLIGMLLGAMLVGSAAARFGRRTMFLATVAFFSALMAITAAASGPELFALLRFFAGLGLGGVMPLAAALTTEFAPPGRRNLSYVIMQSGYPVGGVVASVLAMALLPVTDWRIMYLLGALPLILILPFAWRLLPESEEYLDARRGGSAAVATRKDRSGDGPASGVRTASEDSESTPSDARSTGRSPVLAGIAALFAPGYKSATVLFWTMSFCSLLFVYGINTWLPTLMLDAGYALSSSLRFLLAFNAGAIVGGIAGGWAADRWTPNGSSSYPSSSARPRCSDSPPSPPRHCCSSSPPSQDTARWARRRSSTAGSPAPIPRTPVPRASAGRSASGASAGSPDPRSRGSSSPRPVRERGHSGSSPQSG